jgi:hypothetical protein
MSDNSRPLPASRIIPGPALLRQYPAQNLAAWQTQGVLDDDLLDETGEWLCATEKASVIVSDSFPMPSADRRPQAAGIGRKSYWKCGGFLL